MTTNATDALAGADLDQLSSEISRSGDGYVATLGLGVAG